MIGAKVVDVSVKIVHSGGIFLGDKGSIGQRSQRSQQEVASMEARGDNYTIYIRGKTRLLVFAIVL